MALLGGIDLGSNTFRLLIAEVGKEWRTVYSQQKITRLGEGVARTGTLSPHAIARALSVLKDFQRAMARFPLSELAVVATSAVREAQNGHRFVQKVKEEIGFEVEVISGIEEAKRTLKGVQAGLSDSPSEILVIDIGGGSTEFILSRRGDPPQILTTDLGVVSLTERYITKAPLDPEELLLCEEAVEKRISRVAQQLSLEEGVRVIGTAGTVTTLAALAQRLSSYDPRRIHNFVLSRASCARVFEDLAPRTLIERRRIPCLEPGREDVIIAGCVIVMKICEILGREEMTVSEYGLREGIILDRWEKRKEQ